MLPDEFCSAGDVIALDEYRGKCGRYFSSNFAHKLEKSMTFNLPILVDRCPVYLDSVVNKYLESSLNSRILG